MATKAVVAAKKSAPEISHLQYRLPRTLYRGPVYAQGRLRNPASKAAKKAREDQAVRLEKYLDSAAHGEHIYMWNHIKTNQIIYSLSRTLNVGSMLIDSDYRKMNVC